jgi:hypothetical protein
VCSGTYQREVSVQGSRLLTNQRQPPDVAVRREGRLAAAIEAKSFRSGPAAGRSARPGLFAVSGAPSARAPLVAVRRGGRAAPPTLECFSSNRKPRMRTAREPCFLRAACISRFASAPLVCAATAPPPSTAFAISWLTPWRPRARVPRVAGLIAPERSVCGRRKAGADGVIQFVVLRSRDCSMGRYRFPFASGSSCGSLGPSSCSSRASPDQ